MEALPKLKVLLTAHLLVGELLPQVGHHVPQLGGGDEAVTILVEDTERLPNLLFAVQKERLNFSFRLNFGL